MKKSKNVYFVCGDVCFLSIKSEKRDVKTKFDYCYFEEVSNYQWHCDSGGYIRTHVKENGKSNYLFLHQVIVNGSKFSNGKVHVDHIDGDRLNNTLENLRICTAFENLNNLNTCKNKTGFQGIYVNRSGNFSVQVWHNNKRVTVGTFGTIDEAVKNRTKFILENK